MIYEIANDCIKLAVSSMGAEPMSIKSVKEGLEYLWQGDPKYWANRSPTLFPIVGRLDGGKYLHDGKEFELEGHGFARFSEFELVKESGDSLVFRLVENEKTLARYPFRFELFTSYRLKGNAVLIEHRVVNKEQGPIWFSIGEHPGFNCPLFEGETMEDYSLVFEKEETVKRRYLDAGLSSGKEEVFLENEKEVGLSYELFKKLAIILKGLKSKYVTLKSKNHDRRITVTIENYPYLGIWSPDAGAPFVCIEPWYGVSSSKDGSRQLKDKEGIIKLMAGQIFECGYSIAVE